MSATLSTIIRPAATRRSVACSRLFGACLNSIANYFFRRAAIAHLRELDDRELRDIGLVRSQIEGAVQGFMASDRVIMASASAFSPTTREAAPWT